jgi:hypothetical protein
MAMGPTGARCQDWACRLVAGSKLLLLKNTIFCVVMPGSPTEFHRFLGRIYCLHLHCRRLNQASNQKRREQKSAFFSLVSFLAYSSTLMMQVVCSSEKPLNFYRNRRRHTPENSIVTCMSIVRQRLGKHIPAEANASSNKSSIVREQVSKHASLTTEAVFYVVRAKWL